MVHGCTGATGASGAACKVLVRGAGAGPRRGAIGDCRRTMCDVRGGGAAGARPPRLGAQTFEAVGVRAPGMGGAFVAVADDATAVYWNPAGLRGRAGERGGRAHRWRHRPPGLGRRPAARPDTAGASGGERHAGRLGVPPLGVSYYRLRQTGFDGSLTGARPGGGGALLVTDNVAVNLLQSLGRRRARRRRAAAGPRRRGAASGPGPAPIRMRCWRPSTRSPATARGAVDVDAGLLVARGRWRGALVARNLASPTFERRRPASSSSLVAPGPRRRRLLPRSGDHARARRRSDADGDRDRRRAATWRSASSRRSAAASIVRGGVRLNTIDDARPAGALGASVAVTSSIWVDAQVTRGGRDAERRWGVGLRFGF